MPFYQKVIDLIIILLLAVFPFYLLADSVLTMSVSGAIIDKTCTFSQNVITVNFDLLDKDTAVSSLQGQLPVNCSQGMQYQLSTDKASEFVLPGTTQAKAYLCLSLSPITDRCESIHSKHFSSEDTDNSELTQTGSGADQIWHYTVTIHNALGETSTDISSSWDLIITPI